MFKNRLRNYGLWVSVAALIPLLLSAFGINLINEDKYVQVINCILSILVALGLINNPDTNNRWYKDDKIEECKNEKLN
ncbi:hypothetical protein SFBM_0485 [Candidatus Arthromitus sp. SFB-mouse-Japan]|jgi:Small integral membrane protein|uniref:phage holin n=1 Tax=unclassified Candidatus Neoarthromitus TaxID=2638829 RepID=UPI00021B7ED7|nr:MULTISPECIES: phage holin [unclassified Candidatus Arthromitus]EIA22874.1 hypothetical protein SFB3_330G1 [Candidatus Arthromitus sp. SFB-3]EIA23053.1 hypothetical protein SFB1_218G0 [Candidatus Arthromitus sp. SFB-1]EIA24033.1 hypothetical protein SFB2_112G1 [Candidatus Arthromitus sp. SFB-2]EIA26132.1 hypothetical protein SFB5_290G10 [Candidatus Arthromitus sp. SFB-5]EIA27190.1 Phage holin-like protein [Candidatus Arthromitus sp. SFB-co]EIA30534.1 putative phage holin [Candidatus Arthrom